jgi:NAD(P)-dependent dehydrogenase (short-subunit alcohol dehydrogenase family)
MAASSGGNIINVSSDHVKPAPGTGWHHGHGAMDLYDASKWALNGLTFDWAKALRRHNIGVNNLCMGATDTEMLRDWIGSEPDQAYLAFWMTPEGIADVVLDLIAEGPDGRTGDNIGLWAGHPTVLPPIGEDQQR